MAGAIGGGVVGLGSGGLTGGVIGGAYEGFLGPQGRFVNPNGWNAVAGPVLRGIRGGVASSIVSTAAAWVIDQANAKFGDCGCGKK